VLLSGVDTHLNGLGSMDEWTAPNQRGAVGYEGYLNNRVVTLPQLLMDAGYHTYMVGKWHLCKAPEQIPAARGFERHFSLLDGAGSSRDYLFAAINWSQTHPNAWGDPGSYVGYGPMWTQVSMTPFSE
jgi:arylsulfatase A-like enzyme